MPLRGPTPWLLVQGSSGRSPVVFSDESGGVGFDDDERLRAVVASVARRLIDDGLETLPIFVSQGPFALQPASWLERLRDISGPRLVVVNLRADAYQFRRPPLELPLVVATAPSTHADDLARLIAPDPGIPSHGLVLTDRLAEADIVVASTPELPDLSRFEGSGVRLVIADQASELSDIPDLVAPHGIAVVVGTAGFAAAMLAGIADDLPVHEAAWRADPDSRVWADPGTNDGLRLAPLVRKVEELAGELSFGEEADDLDLLVARAAEDPESPPALEALGPPGGGSGAVERMAQRADDATPIFDREDTSLRRVTEALDFLQTRRLRHRRRRDLLGSDPDLRAAVDRYRERRVDLALRDPDVDGEPTATVNRPLEPGERRLVVLRIGRPLRDSAMPTKGPPIDPILPLIEDDEGHTLEMTVYGLDFTVEGPATKELRLPRWTPSEERSIAVRAPREPTDRARARVALYHENHLVQSFVLEAGVGTGPPPEFRLDFSRSQRLTNLDDLQPRALSIAVNQTGGAHAVMIKTPTGEVGVPISAGLLDRHMGKARMLLLEMKAALAVAPYYSAPDRPRPIDDGLRAWWRKLANEGEDAYRDLSLEAGNRQEDLLDDIMRRHDLSLQINRIDVGFAYPWPLLYDWVVPIAKTGAPPPAVCFGQAQDGSGGCDHGPGAEVICVNGFWGVRHVLEQVVDTGRDPHRPVCSRPGTPVVRLGIGIDDDWTRGLRASLGQLTGTLGEIVAPNDDDATLVEHLWDPAWRPAAIVVVAHHLDAAPEGSRLKLGPTGPFLAYDQVFRAVQLQKSWRVPPNSIVLLMACDAGVVTSAKIDTFATVLSRAGAGGVVATELEVDTDFAARCAHDVTERLLDGDALGVAMQRLYRDFAYQGNPFAFSMFSIGSADMDVSRDAS